VPVISWFDDPSDRTLLDLIPFFENLAKVEDIYQFLESDNLPSSTTMYVGAVSHHHIPVPVETPIAPIFSSSVQTLSDSQSSLDEEAS
jgi:hypothetical protein